jgi:uncharacterized protein YecT (DUF1311 family)
MDILEKIGFVLLGALVSGFAYLIKRKIESKPQIEALDKHKKILDIHKQMNDQGIDIEGLRILEAKLVGKSEAIRNNTIILQKESVPLIYENEAEDLNQAELNERAGENFERAKDRMQKVIAAIDSRVDDSRSQSLMNSQMEWESYSVSQAQAVASSYDGGSIYNLIYLSELESLTNERTARLQAELDELIQLGN